MEADTGFGCIPGISKEVTAQEDDIRRMIEHDAEAKPEVLIEYMRALSWERNMVEGVVIAAGMSMRTGTRNKLSLPIGGQAVIWRSVSCLLPYCRRIHVVTGHRAKEISDAIFGLPDVNSVFNADYASGMFGSILTGLREVTSELCLFLPGDCPFVEGRIVELMLENPSEILIPRFEGQPGHPVLLGRRTIDELISGGHEGSLRSFLEANGPTYIDVPSPGILKDIDTIEDYEKYVNEMDALRR